MIQVKKTSRKDAMQDLMSAEELKTRLQQHFAKSGTLNNVKTQLRNQLVTELFKVAELPTSKFENEFSDAEAKKTLLPLQVSNWLVYDHLKRQGYDYTLSTFVIEASVSFPEKLLSLKDVLDLLGLRSESEESETITEHYIQCKQGSFLHSLLSCVMKLHTEHHLPGLKCDKSTVPKENSVPAAGASNSMHPPQHFLNGSQTKQQNQLLASKLLNESPNDDADMHQHKFYQEMQSEKEEQEKEVQRLRQKLLNELDRLYEHEQQVRLELEQRKRRLTREQDLLDLDRSKLRAKELELAKRSSLIESETEKMYFIKEESLSSSLKEKEEELGKLGAKLQQQEQKLSEERLMLGNQKIEIEDLRNQLQQSESNCHSVEDKYSALLAENTFLKSKVENVTDSSHLRAELLNNLKEIESCKIQIREIKEKAEAEKHVLLGNVENLQAQLKIHLQKATDMKDVSIATESAYIPDESVWNQQRDRLERELGETKQLYQEVLEKLQQQNEDIQDLHLTVHVLHNELSDTANRVTLAAKAEDRISHPPPSVPSAPPVIRSGQVARTSSAHTHQSLNHFSSNARYPGLYYPLPTVQRTFNNDPYKFISEAKKRISDLEQEAQVVKKKYSTFVASQGYAPYGSVLNNYDLVSQNYTIPSYKFPLTGDPYLETSYLKNTAEGDNSFPGRQDIRPSRNYSGSIPIDHYAQFLNDEQSVSHKMNSFGGSVVGPSDTIVFSHHGPVQKLNTWQSNEKSDLRSHVQIISSHKQPIYSDSSLVTSVPPVSNDLQFSVQPRGNDELHPASFPMSPANVSSAVPHSSAPSKYANTDHPFHLSKFGLHTTAADKTIPTASVIASDKVLPHSGHPKVEEESHGEGDNISSGVLSQQHSKMSDTCVQNDDGHLNSTSNVEGKSLVGLDRKSKYCSGEEKASLYSDSQGDFKQAAPSSTEQTSTSVSNHFNSVFSKREESVKDNNITQRCDEGKSDKSVSNVIKQGDQLTSLTLNQNPEATEDDNYEKITGTKPKSGLPFRRISVDLDSAWRQQTASISPTPKNFMRPRSCSSHSIPSRFDLTEVVAAASLKANMKSDLKCDGVSGENAVSSPRSHSFTETRLVNDLAKSKVGVVSNYSGADVKAHDVEMHQASENLGSTNYSGADVKANDVEMQQTSESLGSPRNYSGADVKANDVEMHRASENLESSRKYSSADAKANDVEVHQESESLGSSHESLSDKKSDVDVEFGKGLLSHEKHLGTVDLNSGSHGKQSSSSEAVEIERQSELGGANESHSQISENAKSLKSLSHTSQQSEKEIDTNAIASADLVDKSETVAPLPSESNVDFVDNDLLHTKNTELGAGGETSTVPPADETDGLQSGHKNPVNKDYPTTDPISEKKAVDESNNNCNEGAVDESISELSELNLSAGNGELELSKGDESDW